MVQHLPCLLLTTINAFVQKIDVAVELRTKAAFPSFGDVLTLHQFPLAEMGGIRRFQAWKPIKEHAVQHFWAIDTKDGGNFEDTNRDMRGFQSLTVARSSLPSHSVRTQWP